MDGCKPLMDANRWDQIGTLFSAAIKRPQGEREGFLANACGEDRELYQEVEALVVAHSRTQSDFLDKLDGKRRSRLIAPEPEVLEHVGPWRVLGEIGRGGMGVVYEARRDDGQFEQLAALKLIKRGMDSDQILERFLRERQILARMEHPGIARLLDGGVAPDGRPWFALERIEGVPLTRYCNEQQLDVKARLRLFGEACVAVEYAHRNLVIHRDLKPSNVLVDSEGRVKLLDFGIAKLLRNDRRSEETRTVASGRLMTPGYGAPELALGGAITTATDVYSLGIMLFELLSGQRPHHFGKGDIGQQMLDLSDSESPRLSQMAAVGANNDLDMIAAKAIQIEPTRRYVSAEALREDIERFLRGEPVRACPDSITYRAKKFLRRHRGAVIAVGLVFTSLLTGLSVALWQAGVAARERDIARQESEYKDQVKAFIIELFRASDPRDQGGSELTARQLLDRGLERVRSIIDGRPDLQIELLTTIGEVSMWLGDHKEARALFQEALELEVGAGARNQLRVAVALTGFAKTSAYLGDDQIAEEYHRRALDIRIEFSGPESLETAQSYNNLGAVLASQYKLPEAIEAFLHSLEIQERATEQDDNEVLITRGNLGAAYHRQGNYPEAERILREVIGRMASRQESDHPTMVTYLNDLAMVLKRRGDFREAERQMRASLDLSLKFWGEAHPITRIEMNNYAMAAHDVGNDVEALALMEKTLEYDLEQFGPEHTYIATDRDNLARVLLDLGQLEEATAQFELAEGLHAKWSSPRTLATHQVHQARGLLAAGHFDHARELTDRALATERELTTLNPEKLAFTLTAAAYARSGLGLRLEAAALFDEALGLYESRSNAGHPSAGVALFGLGELRLAQDRLDEARGLLEQAAAIWAKALPESHWRHAEIQIALGECDLRAGKIERGRRILDEGIARLRRDLGETHWRTRAGIRRLEALTKTGQGLSGPG